ncbi:hypothetical protein P3S67_015997 [Capsicum chacoense]
MSLDLLFGMLVFANKFCCESLKDACDRKLASLISCQQDALELVECALEENSPVLVASFSMNLDPRSDESVCFLRTLIDSAETSQQKMVAYHRLGCVKFLRKELDEAEQLFEAAFNLGHTYSVVGLARLGQIRGHKHWAHEKLSSVTSSSIPLGWMYQESSLYCQGEKRLLCMWSSVDDIGSLSVIYQMLESDAAKDAFHIDAKRGTHHPCVQGSPIDDLEFLLISSQKNPRMMFPKVGWEIDESLEEAASRETFEEAGVVGEVEVEVQVRILGTWSFKSKSQGTFHEGHMFPLRVLEELDEWPEKTVRRR